MMSPFISEARANPPPARRPEQISVRFAPTASLIRLPSNPPMQKVHIVSVKLSASSVLLHPNSAASGTLSFTPEQTDVNIILYQALGEYEEKLASNALNVVVRKDEEVNTVYADGKLMWRIFDNVLSVQRANMVPISESGSNLVYDFNEISNYPVFPNNL